MRKIAVSSVMIILMCVLITSCGTLFVKGGSDYRSGVSAYERQEYVSSLRYLSETLAVNPGFVEAVQLFPQVFNEGTSYYKSQVVANSGKQDRQSADSVFRAYERLQELHEVALASGQGHLNIEDFSAELRDAREVSANLWFTYARHLREQGDRESLKQAVTAYETARGRNPDIQGIDSLIAEVIQEATVTLAVVAYGSNVEDFSRMVLDDVTKGFSGNRFVKVLQRHYFAPGKDSMVGPVDIAIMTAMSEGWDYVLEVYADQGFTEISKEDPVRLPSDEPLFAGVRKTIGYQHVTSIFYRLFSIQNGVSTVFEDTIREVDGPHVYTFSYVPAEGVRELNLGGTGKKNLRYVTSFVDDVTTDSAIDTLRWDYESIVIPAEVTNPTDQTQWISYFSTTYDDFGMFASSESGRELFYAIEVVHHKGSDTYFMIGPSLDEAIRRSQINSAIMNALSYTARTLVKKEGETRSSGYLKAGNVAVNAIKDLL